MICDRWQTIVVPFPFLEMPVARRRPALVISVRDFNAANGHSMLAMITSSSVHPWPSDCVLEELVPTGLKVPCRVRWKVFALPNDLVDRQLGHLGEADRDACGKQLARLLSN